MKIAVFEIKDWEKDYLREKFTGEDVSFFAENLTLENVSKVSDADVLSVFIYSKLDSSLLRKLPNLRFIATRSTGFEHIDLGYCKSKGIKVANVPEYGSNTVAEHAFSLILALTRRLVEAVERVRGGSFSPEGLTGVDVFGKTLGVVGTGKIGKAVIRIANGFSMNVLAYDVYPDKSLEGVKYVSLENLLKESDIVTLHLPFCEETKHLMNRDRISLMKRGSFLINTARGGLIETDALFDALKEGKIAGCGLDVLEEENFLKEEVQLLYADEEGSADLKIAVENHVLATFPNVIITPHNAFNSKEALYRILDTTIGNIISYKANNLVNIVE